MGMFDNAVKTRQDEISKIEKNLKQEPTSSKLTKITLSITEDDRQKIKIYAAQNNTSVSKLFHQMVESLT